jgi:hypothetical protein
MKFSRHLCVFAHRVCKRGAGLFLCFALIVAGIPKWEVHAHLHDAIGHQHEIVNDDHDHHHPMTSDQGSNKLGSFHMHDVTTALTFVLPAEALGLSSVPVGRIFYARPPESLALAAWPPPYRPPIS